MQPDKNALRALPSVQRLLEDAEALIAATSHSATTSALRQVLVDIRTAHAPGVMLPTVENIIARAAARLYADNQSILRRVINATGIILHTNLGRTPLAETAIAAMAEAARGYTNLEFDLATGKRGVRLQNIEALLCELTGAEAALVVNNNAAAVLLTLSGLAAGGEVIVSRGELVEIGGGFRVPDVIVQGGARLVEVGTTNKTRLADYRTAITEHTRALIKIHQSNFRVIGFTESTSLQELSRLAHDKNLLLIEDLGSGTILNLEPFGRPHEPTVQESIAAGVDIVTLSGDKLLGGPQAGIIVGRADAIAQLRRHPLLRAVRIDKISLAALEATLRLLRDPATAIRDIPVLRMLAQPRTVLQARAETLARALADIADIRIEPSRGYAGGGALPTDAIASVAVCLSIPSQGTEALAAKLRAHRPAIVGRIAGGRLHLDMLTITDADASEITQALHALIA
ncbi:MAG: L-seryl-tRNA(Sec) selenium transferase [Acetobacteraceae bacterium]|nr:L-seryl-tRNA(Sec) selenium transferase [Acetobacteraceae bacterium]